MNRALCVLLIACSGPPSRPARIHTAWDEPLRISVEDRAQLHPVLLTKLQGDPHTYFRYVAHGFARRACELAPQGPTVNLHGDAHVEQYLVTSLGRGLGDFDHASIGPVDVDLLRLATSFRIAARLRSWDGAVLWRRFLEGYTSALEDPSTRAVAPQYAARIQSGFHHDHSRMLAWCDTLYEAVSPNEHSQLELAFAQQAVPMLVERSQLGPDAFEVVRLGRHELGIGSRHQINYLFRTRGLTESPDDDLILEAKSVSRRPDASCFPMTDPRRIIIADERLAYAPFREAGVFQVGAHAFWVHEFVDDYETLSLQDPGLDENEMLELAHDMGVQLGLGHPRGVAQSDQLRRDLLAFAASESARIWALSDHALQAVWAGWHELL